MFAFIKMDNRDVAVLWELFKEADIDDSGGMSSAELLDFIGVEPSGFATRLFAIMDVDGSGEMDFEEFVVATWNFCTFKKQELVCFAFELYDVDNSKALLTDYVEQSGGTKADVAGAVGKRPHAAVANAPTRRISC